MEFASILLSIIILLSIVVIQAVCIGIVNQGFNKKLATFRSEVLSKIGEQLLTRNNDLKQEVVALKNELTLLRTQKSKFLDEKRSSIIDLNSKIESWLRAAVNSSPAYLNSSSKKERDSLFEKTNTASKHFFSSRATYRLYNENEEVRKLLKEFGHAINKAVTIRNRAILNCSSKFFYYEQKDGDKDTIYAPHERESMMKEKAMIHEEIMDIIDQEDKQFEKSFSELLEIRNNIITTLSKEIKKSFEEGS